MQLLKDENVMQIIRNMLNVLDTRLVNHGERVAFLCYSLMKAMNYDEEAIFLGTKLALLHDIGAFKTDEIDNMLSFEEQDVSDHAIYGYLFIKNLSPLKKYADCVLYHHYRYDELMKVSCSRPDIAILIHLCDRIDVMMQHGIIKEDTMKAQIGTGRFIDKHIQVFLTENKAQHLMESLSDLSYLDTMNTLFQNLRFSVMEKHDYLQMIAYSIDFKSQYTVLHTIMTTSLAVEMGKIMHLKRADLVKLYYGALLHDIGKAFIPISILEKPCALDENEMNIMRTHVLVSEQILQNLIPDDVLQIAIRHHEKLDGSGYPYKLTEKDLTACEKIVAVADILSALLGRRSYKEEMSVPLTINIIKKMAKEGKLSKGIVDVFDVHHEKIIKNVQKNSKNLKYMYQNMQKDYSVLKVTLNNV